jgi:rhodanese-related sulfurtransferase
VARVGRRQDSATFFNKKPAARLLFCYILFFTMYRRFLAFLVIGFCITVPASVFALPPPDVIANIGSQFAQIFSLGVVLFSALAGVTLQYSRRFFSKVKGKTFLLALLAGAVILLALGAAFGIEEYRKARATDIYVEEVTESIHDGIIRHDVLSEDNESAPVDFLHSADQGTRFIAQYYNNLGTGQVWAAYAVSKKNVPFETYSSWYSAVTKTEVERIEMISEGHYSIKVKLFEGEAETLYGVLMTLQGGRITESTVRIIAADEESSFAEDAAAERSFFEANKGLPIAISNENFAAAADQGSIFVLDAREDEEYELGHYTGSTHVRFADLIAGSWVGLPTDKVVHVFCWSGIRGKELTEFLRSKGVLARYVEDGANGWVKYGGAWEGEILFATKYSDKRYTGTLSTAEVHEQVIGGAILVDARQAEVFTKRALPGSKNISIFFTPSDELERLFATIPPHSEVITICDDYVSCFDAKIAGVKLEKLGHTFLGRYAAPWEY